MVSKLALIIDDEPDFLELAKSRLETEGYKIITATSGKEGIESIKNNKPNIVFLDIKMPDMDGIDVLRNIRKFNKNIPIVMITAYGTIDNWRNAIDLGIYSYIPKGKPGTDPIDTMLKTLKGLK